jgi:hypothetical protein
MQATLLFIHSWQSIIETSLFSSTPFYLIEHAIPFLHTNPLIIKDTNNKNFKGSGFLYRYACKIGPHNKEILSIIFGSLLGKGTIEIKKDSCCISFYQEARHVNYLRWLHYQLAIAGYCNPTLPKIGKRLGKKGKILKTVSFSTWNLTSFYWIYDLWYVKGIKIIPLSISEYLTPLALAIWIMDSGVKSSGGLKFISCFSYSDCLLIVQVLQKNFGFQAIIHYTGTSLNNQKTFQVYIPKESMIDLKNKISAIIIPNMKYKVLL